MSNRMSSRKWLKLLIILILSLVFILAATQRFDTIVAKRLITTSSSGIQLNGAGMLTLADGGLTMASGDLTLTAGDATVTAGDLAVTAGNLAIGNGTPSFTQDGEDAYIEGETELGSELILGAQTTYVVIAGEPITPTGTYLPMTSAALGVNVTDVVTPTSATIGSLIILHNIDSTDVITIDGTGKIVACKADVALAPQDTLTMLWNGTNWVCLSNYDNS